jgi:multicomponent Na+:H+ antiporter subunit C
MHLVNLNYSFSIILFFLGLYIVLASKDSMKKLFGLSLFQTSVLWFYMSIAKVSNAKPAIISLKHNWFYSNPLPHVLMLTAIVVGLAITALGFALIINKEKK